MTRLRCVYHRSLNVAPEGLQTPRARNVRCLACRDDHRTILAFHGYSQATVLGEQASIERLDGMGVDRMVGRPSSEQRRDRRLDPGVKSGCGDTETDGFALTDGVDGELPASRYRLAGEKQHIEQEFDAILRQQNPR